MFDMDAFIADLNQRKEIVEQELQRRLPPEDTYPGVLHRAMRYAVFNGGKRLRPILVLEGAKLAGASVENVMPVACAMEMIHTYSLVHDDLPSMDDDDLRRGKPTCHRVFGEANAILTGDALLTAAFELMTSNEAQLEPARLLRVIGEIASAAGSQGMVGGQVLDLGSDEQVSCLASLQKLHFLKTGALFKASLRSGAILGGMHEQGLQDLTQYAIHFGLAFQITDDILDVEGDQQLLGKPVGSDAKNGKTTFTSLFGVDGARRRAEEYVAISLHYLESFGIEAEFLRDLASFTLHRRS